METNHPIFLEELIRVVKAELDAKNVERDKLITKLKAGTITLEETNDLELLIVDIVETSPEWRSLRRQRDQK